MSDEKTKLIGGTFGLFRFYLSRHFALALIILVFLAAAGLAEGFGVALLLPVLGIAANESVADNSLANFVSELLTSVGLPLQLGWLLGLVVASVFLKTALTLLAQVQSGYARSLIARDLRLDLISAIMGARWSYFTHQPVGALSNSMSIEAEWAASGFQAMTKTFASLFQVLFYAILAIVMSWHITLAAVLFGIITVLSSRHLLRRARRAAQLRTDTLKLLVTRLNDGLTNLKALKAMADEDRIAPMLETQTETLNKAQRAEALYFASLESVHEPLLAVLLSIGIFFALAVWSLPLSELLFLAVVFMRLVRHASALQIAFQSTTKFESALTSILSTTQHAAGEQETWSGGITPSLGSEIELQDVYFEYGELPVLRGVSLTVPAGRFTTLQGPSGAGKTTVVDLIVGLHQPARGSIRIDGVPLSEIDLHAWRKRIGYVPQDTILFNDSIHRNVTLGDPAFSRTDTEAALRAVGAWDFVTALPDGMNTGAGEHGWQISGGQRQRIAIARAMIRNPELLILDEATSALDPATEAAICATLAGLKNQVSILAISHQPALGRIADTVYAIDHGKVEELETAPAE